MTKFIIYVLTMFLSGVLFFYVAILWNKVITFVKKNRVKKLQPSIKFLVDEYLDAYLFTVKLGKRNTNKLSNDEEHIATVKNSIVSKLNILVKKDLEGRIIEEYIFSFHLNKDKFVKEAISELSNEIGLVKKYIKALYLKDHHKVADAVEKLGRFRHESANKHLIKVLKRGNAFESYNVLVALAKIGNDKDFIEAFNFIEEVEYFTHRSLIHIIDSFEGDLFYVYKTMISHTNNYVASLFIKSASNILHNNSKVLKKEMVDYIKCSIIPYLNSQNIELKIATIKFLGETNDASIIDKIALNLEDLHWEVRAITAKVLGNFYDGTQHYLMKAMNDRVWTVRYNAAFSLIRTKNYLDYVKEILNNEDKFAKDIIIAVLDNTKKINEVKDKNILEKITHHIEGEKGND